MRQPRAKLTPRQRAALRRRVRAWYARARADLIKALGGKCVQCKRKGRGKRLAGLEFDHPGGRTWYLRGKSRWGRLAIVRREAAAGLIQILCRSCNARDGGGRRKGTGGDLATLHEALGPVPASLDGGGLDDFPF